MADRHCDSFNTPSNGAGMLETIGLARRRSPISNPLAYGSSSLHHTLKLIFSRTIWGTWFSTLEHELTHVLFALLTFHR